jgi:hypothetical protein
MNPDVGNGLASVPRPDLPKDVVYVILDGGELYHQSVGDLLVRVTLTDKVQNFLLTSTESVLPLNACVRLSEKAESSHQYCGYLR